jgi:hypothetical protein
MIKNEHAVPCYVALLSVHMNPTAAGKYWYFLYTFWQRNNVQLCSDMSADLRQ